MPCQSGFAEVACLYPMTKKLKTTDVFSKEFIQEMKEKLLTMQTDLMAKLGIMAPKSPATNADPDATYPEYGDEDEDNVHEIEEFVVNQNVKIEYEKELRDVEEALERMKKNTYGICKYTGEAIPEERLRVRPTSSSSVAAKTAFKP